MAACSAGDCPSNPILCPFLSVASATFQQEADLPVAVDLVSLFIVGVEFLCSVLLLRIAVIEKIIHVEDQKCVGYHKATGEWEL